VSVNGYTKTAPRANKQGAGEMSCKKRLLRAVNTR
jgi:hypothetical protein